MFYLKLFQPYEGKRGKGLKNMFDIIFIEVKKITETHTSIFLYHVYYCSSVANIKSILLLLTKQINLSP